MKKNIIELPKGGFLIDTSIGTIQIGSPPETIKDSLSLDRDVPQIFICPKKLFSYKRMISMMDMEFPCNYNFFIKKIKTTIICTKKQKKIIYDVLKESILGPEKLNIELEYKNDFEKTHLPNIELEMGYFRKHPVTGNKFNLDDIVDFITFDDNNNLNLGNLNIKIENDILKITDKDEIYEINWDFELPEIKTSISQKIFIPPSFGITTLGSSHGFDPKGKTSGFIFWINGVGILVDPPVDSALWLIEENISPRMVDSVILTHCHSDHDSGVMQKLLQEGRIKLYTTPTIFSSFVKKISYIIGMNEVEILDLIEFIPVPIHKPININGANFIFSYRLHSIPTIGFEVNFRNKSVVYTSDHLNDKNFFDILYKEKILTESRYKELSNFDWNKDYIIHEAGIPPLHTPLETLLNLPEEVKKNIYLVHTDKSKLPENSNLKISPTGLSNSLIINNDQTAHGESIEILNILNTLELFNDLPLKKAVELLSIIKYYKFKKDDCIIKEGTYNNNFFIIITGNAKIIHNNETRALISSGSYFGETSILGNTPATNTIIAITDIITITINKDDFLAFISNTGVFEKLQKLSKNRKLGSLETINENKLLRDLTINQKNNLEIILEEMKCEENEIIEISTENQKQIDYAILWKEGIANVEDRSGNLIKVLAKGDFIGTPKFLLESKSDEIIITSKTKSSFFRIYWQDMMKFFKNNPKILLQLRNSNSIVN